MTTIDKINTGHPFPSNKNSVFFGISLKLVLVSQFSKKYLPMADHSILLVYNTQKCSLFLIFFCEFFMIGWIIHVRDSVENTTKEETIFHDKSKILTCLNNLENKYKLGIEYIPQNNLYILEKKDTEVLPESNGNITSSIGSRSQANITSILIKIKIFFFASAPSLWRDVMF